MKRKSLFLIVFLLLVTTFVVGCKTAYTPNPYNDFTKKPMELDGGVSLDGVLDDVIWQNAPTLSIAGVTVDEFTKTEVDLAEFGERSAKVRYHIGEKALYFAFDVTDKNLYYNKERGRGQNSGVEIYLTGAETGEFNEDCFSVRVSPTGYEGKESASIQVYKARSYFDKDTKWKKEWRDIVYNENVEAAVKVDGNVKNSGLDDGYSTVSNNGYVVEIAINLGMLGKSKDAVQFTAAFCQARSFSANRIGNSFLAGTSYVDPLNWVLGTKDGIVADKTAYRDAKIAADAGYAADGNFTESIWNGATARTFTTSFNRIEKPTEKIKYAVRSTTTDNGVYVGLESNDGNIYYHDGVREYFSTGAEIGITVNGATTITDEYTVQYRYLVGGASKRLRGMTYRNDVTWSYSDTLYYPALAGGKIIDGELNEGAANGWACEIFIPWHAFKGEVTNKSDVAVMVSGYVAYEDGPDKFAANGKGGREYLSPVTNIVYSGGGANMNPQKKWFTFSNGKAKYAPLRVHSLSLDRADLIFDTQPYYSATVTAKHDDDVVTKSGFKEQLPTLSGGEFDFGGTQGVITTDKGDGEYEIKIPTAIADQFSEDKEVIFTANGEEGRFNIAIDSSFALDGIKDERAWEEVKALTTTQTTGVTVTNEFALTLRENSIYLSAVISDARFTNKHSSYALGLEMYFNFGDALDYESTYGVRVLSNDREGYVFRYDGVSGEGDQWPWVDNNLAYAAIKSLFVDNNDGTYTVEAKIPYSIFGRTEKPESVLVAPFTRFMKSDDKISTKLLLWEGGLYTIDLDLYQRFTANGYEPSKVVLFDGYGDKVDEIVMVKTEGVSDGFYEGEFTLALYPSKVMPITDAQFGDYTQYLTALGGGKYSYALPVSLFSGDEVTIPVTSAAYSLSSKIKLSLLTVTQMFVQGGENNMFFADKNGGKLVLTVKVTADEKGKLPLSGVVFANGFSAVDNGDGFYTVSVDESLAKSRNAHIVNLTYASVSGSARFIYEAWTADETARIKTYINFNGNVEDEAGGDTQLTIVGNPVYTNRTGINDAMKMVVKPVGTPNDGVDVGESLGNGSFSISFDFKAYSEAFTENNSQYELVSSGVNVDQGADTFQMSFNTRASDGPGFRIQLGTSGNYFPIIANARDTWHKAVFIVERSSSSNNVKTTLYIDGEINGIKEYTVAVGQSLGDGIIHLGGADWKYTTGVNKPFEMDNFMLYNGVMTAAQIAKLPK